MVEYDWKAYLNDIIKSQHYLNGKGRKIFLYRGNGIKQILSEICKCGFELNNREDVVRQEYRAAINLYLLGSIQDAIFHATYAVEFGLLMMLDQKLDNNKKEKIHSEISNKGRLTFRTIVVKAGDEGLLEGDSLEKTHKLVDKRNIYVHPQNFIPYVDIVNKEIYNENNPFFKKTMSMVKTLRRNRLSNFLFGKWADGIESRKRLIELFPDLTWCGNDRYGLDLLKELKATSKRLEGISDSTFEELSDSDPKSENHTEQSRNIFKKRPIIVGALNNIEANNFLENEIKSILKESFDILQTLKIF